MKRTMYYRTKWNDKSPPFLCINANKYHFPTVTVIAVTEWRNAYRPDEILYKRIDDIMYEQEKGSFETLAEGIASGVLKFTDWRVTKVTVRVEEDLDFWVEVVGQRDSPEAC